MQSESPCDGVWKVEFKAHNSIYHQCIQGEHVKTLQQNHNKPALKPSRKLYPGREQLVSPSMRSFGAENCVWKPGIRVIKKKSKTPLRALTCTWPQKHHLRRIQITTRARLLQHLVLHMRSWQCRGGELAERTSQTSSVLMLSNTCRNGGVHPSYAGTQNPLFAHALTHLSQEPTVCDGETSSGSDFSFGYVFM